MEDYTEDSKNVATSEPLAPVALPFDFPPEYRNHEYFTISEIVKCVEIFFEFSTESYYNKEKGNKGNAQSSQRNTLSYTGDAVRQYIYRALRKRNSKVNKGNRENTYSREIVEDFFYDSEIQGHFLGVAIAQKERDVKRFEKKIQECDKRVGIEAHTSKEKLAKKKAAAEADLKRARAQKEKLTGSPEQRKAYVADCIASFDQAALDVDDDIEDKSTHLIEECKKRILFQFLFDSFIKLDEGLLREDIKYLLNVDDELHATDREIWAAVRFKDLHNYYTERIDLADFLRKICGNNE